MNRKGEVACNYIAGRKVVIIAPVIGLYSQSVLVVTSEYTHTGRVHVLLDGGERDSVRATLLEGGHTATGEGIGSGRSIRYPLGKRRDRRTGPRRARPLGGGPIRGPRRAIDVTYR